ncbi:hypothetical protein NLI96_g8179 [Meripilus lineatus]|uniref:Uncharacterized protein n=1 Tax=Meripilus lineatus TaxID=2056292 RepID=A0AAD5UY01_9APHY|nr:hypothetical protein NLI96_g8179 [Physisporinus lineatus]
MNIRLLSIGLTPSDNDGDVGEKHEESSSQAQFMGRMVTHYDRLPDSQHNQVEKVLFPSARIDTFWKLESRHSARFADELPEQRTQASISTQVGKQGRRYPLQSDRYEL